MTAASIKSGTGITRFTGSIVASVGSTSALDNNLTPRTSSTVSAGTAANSATNGTGVQYREACCKFFTNTTGAVYGTRLQLSSARDTTGALVFAHVSSSANNPFLAGLTTIRGLGMFLNSSSLGTEEASWMMKGTGDLFDDYSVVMVDPSRSTNTRQYDNGSGGRGTFDPTDVTDVGVCYQHTAAGPSIRISSIGMLKPVVVIGGTTSTGNFDVIKNHFSTNVTLLHREPAQDFHLCDFPWQIGDGTTATKNEIYDKSFVYPDRVNFSTPRQGYHFNDNFFGHRVLASASDYIRQGGCSHSSGTPIHFTIGGDPAADFYYSTITLTNVGEASLADGFHIGVLNAVAWIVPLSCSQPTIDSGSFTDCTDAGIESDSDDALANCGPITFSGNAVGIRITVTGDCALDVSACTFSGNTYDIEYTGTGTLTVTAATSLTTNATGGGTITVVSPTTTLVIQSSEASALVQIYADSTTQTLLDSGTGSASYTYTGSGTVFYEVKLAGFILVRASTALANTTLTVTLAADEAYNASHGLTYTTDLSYNRSTKRLTISNRNLGRNIYSALVDAFIAESGLRNTEFPFRANGPTAYTMVNGAEVVDSTSLDKWYGAAIRYEDTSDVETAWWLSFESQGTPPTGGTGEFQRVAGSGTTDARASGAFNQIVQMYGDSTHGNVNYSNFVAKYQANGFRPLRVDLKSLYNIATLESLHYVAAMQAEAIAAATGDPAITLTITDHGASPVTWQSKSWSITITSDSTGEEILRELSYNLSLDATYQGKDPFNWPEMVIEAGSKYETARGVTEGGTGATLKGVRVITSGGDAHPDFIRFQADDGTYYEPAVSILVSAPNLVDDTRILLWNVTQDVEIDNDVVAGGSGYSIVLTEGTEYDSGDQITLLATYQQSGTAKNVFRATATATTTSIAFTDAQTNWTYHNTAGVDGATVTECATDYLNIEVEVDDLDDSTTKKRIAAFIVDALQTADGIRNWVALDGTSIITYVNEGSAVVDYAFATLKVSNVKAGSALQVVDPFKLRSSTGASLVDESLYTINWDNAAEAVVVETGVSGLTPEESAALLDAATVTDVNNAVSDIPTNAELATALGTLNDVSASELVAAIKADTQANPTDYHVNIKAVNSVLVDGAGTEADPFGPV